jgi:hypothetical protein
MSSHSPYDILSVLSRSPTGQDKLLHQLLADALSL